MAEATAPSGSDAAAASNGSSPIASVTPATPVPAAQPATKGPTVIALGQTPDEVVAIKGQPTSKFNGTGKIVYIYPDMKITFKDGKLADVQ